jgi:hypothetical protein
MASLHLRRHATVVLASLTLVMLLAASAPAAPDWNRLDDPMQGGIGLHAGKIGGTGLAFKWPLKWFLQFQVAGGIWRSSTTRWGNIGFELQYILRQDPKLRLYLLTGLGFYNDQDRKRNEAGQEYWANDKQWNTGFGVGAERLLGERFAFKLDVDFTYGDKDESITVWPQAGLLFYW